MVRILMVCLGNICRSPLAHGILQSKLPQEQYYVDSAGTGNYHIGELPDLRSIEVAKSNGIDLTDQQCRQFKVSDFEFFDHIYVMDRANYNDLKKMARNSEDIEKIKPIYTDSNGKFKEIPDPYFGDLQDFENVYSMLNEACELISRKMLK